MELAHIRKIEEDLIDTLIGWKQRTESMAKDTAAARAAVAKAKELEVWRGKYGSFKEWLKEECDITEQWAYALVSSTKTILAIEDAAAESKSLQALNTPENSERLRALPDRAINKLKRLPAAKAAKVALKAIRGHKGVPTTRDIEAEIVKLNPKAAGPEHKALVAMDAEWEKIKKVLPFVEFPAKDVYGRLRAAVESSL